MGVTLGLFRIQEVHFVAGHNQFLQRAQEARWGEDAGREGAGEAHAGQEGQLMYLDLENGKPSASYTPEQVERVSVPFFLVHSMRIQLLNLYFKV